MVTMDPFAMYQNIERHDELSSSDAAKAANDMCIEGRSFRSAVVIMNHGLLLLESMPGDYQSRGVHFAGANCGYDGQGVQAAAYILALFEFGNEDELFAKLKRTRSIEFLR